MKKVCLLLSALLLNGCLHPSPQSHQAAQAAPAARPYLTPELVAQTITKGKTTKDEIVARLGAPNSVLKNERLPTAEQIAKAKQPLPPVAYTVEFWNYWNTSGEIEKAMVAGSSAEVYRLVVFMDKNGVAVDYAGEMRKVEFTK
ncbi:hypothetical protein KOM00_14695 [Geomonas sp. Red69]|uniref:Lipoprotein n=1 Tax=Geomonas diazotrophica TaxID=2843197 RepID=A0ABX8JDF3_9BACT|nr:MULTISPECIES: hypothetical protein [Geomonas]MBU5637975.1 hypothetical protein [Geomonas diazotrophica]QWV96410.1 hypothetical protein KP005_13645 [Geomonas nitrogeniifigens]QXE85475.1 hypothetical protein KP003_13925 [Geomonas nitrogeniifigens]